MHQLNPLGGRAEGPDTWYEDTYLNFDEITHGAEDGFAENIDKILKSGQALLPEIAAWISAEIGNGTDFTYPGPVGPTDEAAEKRIAEALKDPQNISVDPYGRIRVVVAIWDPRFLQENDPHVVIGSWWMPSVEAIRDHKVYINQQGEFRDATTYEPVESAYLHDPIHAPFPLYYHRKELSINDIPTIDESKRNALLKYGKAISCARSINSLPTDNMENYRIYVGRAREEIRGLFN